MENSRVSANIRNLPCSGKQSLLPPKCPFPSISPSYPDHVSKVPIGSKGIPSPRDRIAYHQRTSSESNLIEEQPSWLDELLNEPESPVRKGHRRSSSDSFAYIDAVTGASNIDYLVHDEYKFKNQVPSWRSHCFDHSKDLQQIHFYRELNSFRNQKSSAWEPTFNSLPYNCGHPATTDNSVIQRSGFPQEADVVSSTVGEKPDHVESGVAEPKSSSERKDGSLVKVPVSEADTKRAKQQFAQRSRVRKLQYIAELERNVQTLQAEGSEFSAELEFLNQQSLILGMENKALKQRLENLAQEQLIKYLEHDVLEREIGRLRTLYQHQQQPQPQQQLSSRRSNSRDLNSQFATLSLKHESSTGHDSVSGALRI